MSKNIDTNVVRDFGREWERFDQSAASETELRGIFDKYFSIFPWHLLPKNAVGFDLGCGSGRWAKFVAPRVGRLHCIDPAEAALNVAERNLKGQNNCEFHNLGVDELPFDDETMDFGYSLGVLHHIPNTREGVKSCVKKLKLGAPFLVYLYYDFDDRPTWFRAIWKLSDGLRKKIARLPDSIKFFVCQLIAVCVYFPLARLAKLVEVIGANPRNIPLAFYRHQSLYTMRTDALDRFGTRLEQRFSREEIQQMMSNAGLSEIKFREGEPFHCAMGIKSVL